jgi:uncharacterized protein YpmB
MKVLELIIYLVIFLVLLYVLDYYWLKSVQAFRELRSAYKDYKKAEEDLKEVLDGRN